MTETRNKSPQLPGFETPTEPTRVDINKSTHTPKTGIRMSYGSKRPEDEEGITWRRVPDLYNRRRTRGWMAVAKYDPENPPDNFPPQDKALTGDEEHRPILTHAQAVSEALDRKQDEGTQ